MGRVHSATTTSKLPYSNDLAVSTVVRQHDSMDQVRDDLQALELQDEYGTAYFNWSDLVECDYDAVGNRVTLDADSYARTFLYDELNRIVDIQDETFTSLHQRSYHGAGYRLHEQSNQNGTKTAVQSSGYDIHRRLAQLDHLGSTGSSLASFSYAYNRVGSQLREDKGHAPTDSHQYTYDKANRLVTFEEGQPGSWVASDSYELDGVGNWREHDGNVNPVNEVHEYTQGFDGLGATYDQNGNLIAFDGKTFVYDAKGRIVGSTVNGQQATYAFDAEGRRVLADGHTFTHEGLREIKQRSLNGSTERHYTFAAGLDEIVSWTDGVQTLTLHVNRQGSVIGLTDASGALVERYDYDSYGVATATDVDGGGLVGNDILFAGRRFDANTGLYFLRARYYVPEMGRFTSRDPIGFWGDANNWGNPFNYGGNRPLSGTDPLGLGWFSSIKNAVAGAVAGAVETASFGALSADSVGAAMGADTSSAAFQGGAMAGGIAAYAGLNAVSGGAFGVVDTGVSITRAGLGVIDAINTGEGLGGALGDLALELAPGKGKNPPKRAGGRPSPSDSHARSQNSISEASDPPAPKTSAPENSPSRGGCFTAGTLVLTAAGLLPIEQIEVGQRVLTETGSALADTSIEPDEWRLLEVHVDDGLGAGVRIELLRPLAWVESQGIVAGHRIPVDFDDLEVSGVAEILSVAPCPEIESGEGRVVLATFEREVDTVVDLVLGSTGETITTTPGHRFYSANRGDWIKARALHAGERVEALSGALPLLRTTTRTGSSVRVYNLEVDAEHEYRVRATGVRVHNDCGPDVGDGNAPGSRGYDRPEIETKSGTAVKDTEVTDDWDEFLGPDQTNIDPRDGLADPDRIWSADGKRSIRYGDHEMDSKPSKHHYHKETWEDDAVHNELQRIQQTGGGS